MSFVTFTDRSTHGACNASVTVVQNREHPLPLGTVRFSLQVGPGVYVGVDMAPDAAYRVAQAIAQASGHGGTAQAETLGALARAA
jgi:hypothetical protein